MTRRLLPIIGALALLVATAVTGWLLTSTLQESTHIGSGFNACWSKKGGSSQIECLSARFEAGAADATKGLNGSERDERLLAYVRVAEVRAAEDARLGGLCHPAMHKLGRSEGSRSARAGSVPAFPAGSSQLCTAGYVHGLAEGYLTGTPDAEVAKVFPSLCHVTKAREGCAHGVGHALIRARTTESAGTAAVAATRRCEDLPGEYPMNCMNGVYMELAMRTQPRPVAPSAYVESCRTAADVDRALACWGYLTQNLTTNDIPISDVPQWCARADLPGQYPCIEQYGRALTVDGVTKCESSAERDRLRERCVDGAIGLQVGSGHVSADEAREACATIDDDSLRSYCTTATGRYARGRRTVEKT